ncbi:MAG: hypothetical protein GY772_23770, partial [bacterium]|nr:hypothetical protein [bacterium]
RGVVSEGGELDILQMVSEGARRSAVLVEGGMLGVSNARLNHGEQGVRVEGGALVLDGAAIQNNAAGVVVTGGQADLSNVIVRRNRVGLAAAAGVAPEHFNVVSRDNQVDETACTPPCTQLTDLP